MSAAPKRSSQQSKLNFAPTKRAALPPPAAAAAAAGAAGAAGAAAPREGRAASPSVTTSSGALASAEQESAAKRAADAAAMLGGSAPKKLNSLPQPLSRRRIGGVAQQPPKKLTIENLPAQPRLPDDYEASTWAVLCRAVEAIHCQQPIDYSLEELYRATESLCLHKFSESLFGRLKDKIQAHVQHAIERVLRTPGDSVLYLRAVNELWNEHCSQMHSIRSIFLHLDRTYVLQTPHHSIWDLGLKFFREYVIENEQVKPRLLQCLLLQIELDRRGEVVDKAMLSNLLRMLIALHLYHEYFESEFIAQAHQFYRAEGNQLVGDMEVPEFLLHIERRLREEHERVQHYLDAFTKRPLISVVEKELIECHMSALVQKGFARLMDDSRAADLERMYRALQRVGGLDLMRASLRTYVENVGAHMMTSKERDVSLISDLLKFKGTLDTLLAKAFQGNEQFGFAIREAFERFINVQQNKPAELIAKFLDARMRSGRTETDEESEEMMDRVMVLFRFVQGKDVFEAFYSKDLAKRLLLGKANNMDAERLMIQKLKTECGPSFTMKLEGMFRDMDAGRELQRDFREFREARREALDLGDCDFVVQVLTHGSWPKYRPVEIVTPAFLAQQQEAFKTFYDSRFSGRRLTWCHALGTVVLKAVFKSGRKELSVSVFQALVLLCFNARARASVAELQELTGLDRAELRRTAHSLAMGKLKILQRCSEAGGPELDDADVLEVNDAFSHRLLRIKVNAAVQLKETPQEQKQVEERVFEDRVHQIDAAIVRIMKMRKKLDHNSLLAELFGQIRFQVKAQDVKKRIENLIEKEYMERDRSDRQLYHYVA